MIELQSVSKLYQTVIGVNDINLSLGSGVYGLLGPNGSGKTTLINLILGQIKPTLGSVRLFGINPWRRSHLLRRVGLCPALEFSYPRISALQWVTYLVRLHGFTQRDASKLAKDALETVRLDHVMHRPMTEYSLGMRQRAKIAQSLAHQPDLLILDEPFNGLDPVGRFEMTALLRKWAADGRSLILASHILSEVEAVEPSFLLIYGGRLMASGSPTEMRRILSNTPKTLTIDSSAPHRLAALLMSDATIRNLKFIGENKIEIQTLTAASVLEKLPAITTDQSIEIREVLSSDESLKSLFATLMKIHRGEIETRVTA